MRVPSTCSCRCVSEEEPTTPEATVSAAAPAFRLTRLDLTDFRNHARLSWQPAAAISVIAGPNGSGKTNLLEAISLLGPGRGLRQARVSDFPRKRPGGETSWAVAGRVQTPDLLEPVLIGTGSTPDGGERRLVRIDQAPASQAELASHIAVSWITPQMERLFGEAAGGRRRFLDRLVWALDPAHAREVAAHDAAMTRRNRLLAEGQGDPAWLAGLEDGMAREVRERLGIRAGEEDLAGQAPQRFQQGAAPRGIEMDERLIEQQEGREATRRRDDLGMAQHQAEEQRLLLPGGGQGRRAAGCEIGQREIAAMGAERGAAAGGIRRPRAGQLLLQPILDRERGFAIQPGGDGAEQGE